LPSSARTSRMVRTGFPFLEYDRNSVEADLRQFEHIDNSPSIGTEFRSYSKKGKPVLTIREVLADEASGRRFKRPRLDLRSWTEGVVTVSDTVATGMFGNE
jgi:hypothetical protein